MSTINALRELIRTDATLSIDQDNKVQLFDEKLPEKKVGIKGIPSDSIVIRADRFPDPSLLFQGSRGECKRADFIIASEYAGKKCLVYIEMKSTADTENSIEKQLKGAMCVSKYCEAIIEQFWGQKNAFSGFETRFVSISRMSSVKQPSHKKAQRCNKTPKEVRKILFPGTLHYQELV